MSKLPWPAEIYLSALSLLALGLTLLWLVRIASPAPELNVIRSS